MKFNKLRLVSFFIVLYLSVFASLAPGETGEFYPAKVKDISDRSYEPAVIELLDNAKKSIVMSMYIIKVRDKGPVHLLVKDLEEALDRGVTVEIYLNTRPGHGMSEKGELDRMFKVLTDKGAKLYKFTPHYMLHDKLIIVDERFVVVGSANWSVSALKSNYEATVLIDSPELAKASLLRIRRFPLEGYEKPLKPRPDRPKGLEPLAPGSVVKVSKELLNNKKYFAAMLKKGANRAMDAYLLLLAESARLGNSEFFVPIEDMAVALGMESAQNDTALRRQVIKTLRALETGYRLINVNFSYGKDAWVELNGLSGETFDVTGDFFDPKRLARLSQSAKFVFLIKVFLAQEGVSMDSFSARALARRFGISPFSIRKGSKELFSSGA